MFREIGKRIKSSTHTKYSFLLGYCNGSVGYFPIHKAISEGGYETSRPRLVPVSEQVYVNEAKKLLIGLFYVKFEVMV